METVKSNGATQNARATGAFAPKHETKQATAVELAIGEIVLASIRQTTTESKISAEYCEAMKNENAQLNVLALANESDERFNANQGSIRRVYLTMEKKDAVAKFGITEDMLKKLAAAGDEPLVVMIKNPSVIDKSGIKHALSIQLNDSLAPFDERQAQDPKATAKQFTSSKTGITKYFTKDGKLIFNQPTLVAKSQRNHRIINADEGGIVTWDELQVLQVAKSVDYSSLVANKTAPVAINE